MIWPRQRGQALWEQVWDLRMLRLLRSVPCLDGTVLTWAGSGEAAFASLRRGSDDLHTPAHARRTRHALHTAFRTVCCLHVLT